MQSCNHARVSSKCIKKAKRIMQSSLSLDEETKLHGKKTCNGSDWQPLADEQEEDQVGGKNFPFLRFFFLTP